MTSHSVDPGPETGSGKGDDLAGARVLVVHHDPTFTEPLAMALRFSGFRVRQAGSVGEGLAATGPDWPPDLVVLNVTPDLGPLNIVRRLRADHPRLPVVFLIAWGEVSGKVARLTRETDSYITRPFGLLEVTARVRSVLTRARGGVTTSPEMGVSRYADLELDEATHDVRRSGRLIPLSETEFTLLHYLTLHAERVVTVPHILEHVWGYAFPEDTELVTSYIALLRRKIDRTGPALIHAARCGGYSLHLRPSTRTESLAEEQR